jgi:hypothetical protein
MSGILELVAAGVSPADVHNGLRGRPGAPGLHVLTMAGRDVGRYSM